MSQPGNTLVIKDIRWVIKTFRPLLRLLKVQEVPNPPDITRIDLYRHRDFVFKGMSRCIVVIEQDDLPKNVGGMLITSQTTGTFGLEQVDFFMLNILINKSLCNKTILKDRIEQKITTVHEFTHAVAALSAVSRAVSEPIVTRLKEVFRKKTHAIYYDDIKQIAAELNNSLSIKLKSRGKSYNKNEHFPDEHFRLGFEDFPVSYPVVFEEFLFSKEMFDDYFDKDVVRAICEAIAKKDTKTFASLMTSRASKIVEEKALDMDFVAARIFDILTPIYRKYVFAMKITK